MRRKLVILGDSHTIALKSALQQKIETNGFGSIDVQDLSFGYKFFEPFYEKDENSVRFIDERAIQMLEKINLGPTISRNDDRLFGFCFGFHPSGTMLHTRWAKHSPSLATSKDFVSQAIIDATVSDLNKHIYGFFRHLKTLNVSFFAICCPPLPKGFMTDERKRVAIDQDILTYHRSFIASAGRHLQDIGIPFIKQPQESISDGWLAEDFSANQVEGDYHANAKYGSLILEQITTEYGETGGDKEGLLSKVRRTFAPGKVAN
jgi:hypothetical protein